MGRSELIACFQDTMARCSQGKLEELTRESALGSEVYPENYVSKRFHKVREPLIRVVEGTTFAVARENLDSGKIAVLNFANPHFPGGGVDKGAMAQEECLCRSSNLYPCLSGEQVFSEFYQYHRTKTDYDFSHRAIYTPGVVVFKDDAQVPALLPEEDWFRVDVITCAAPYLAGRRHINSAVLLQLYKDRIRNILEIALEREVDTLILGAFGCGAFQNPPELVARAFHEVFQDRWYRTAFARVIFAIKSSVGGDPYTVCPNLAAFQKEFLGASQELEKLRYIGGVQENPGDEDVTLPGGRIRCRGSEARAYHSWKTGNPLYGKQFSVLGDSVSTLEGFNPRRYPVFYTDAAREKTGIREMADTWWGKVINFFGGELLVNDAWSGCRVTRLADTGERFPSGCSSRRTGNLHVGQIMPDVILVHMGINDWGAGVPVTPEGEMRLENADTGFAMAYGRMLSQLREHYPKAEIWCCTLAATCIHDNPGFRFPEAYGGISIREYNRQIENAALANGCRVIDLFDAGIPVDTLDGTHPSREGMDIMAMLAVRQMADEAGAAMLDCELQHESVNGICRRCGKTLSATARREELRLQLKSNGQILTAAGWQVTLGRSRENHLVLDNPYVARSQATFTCRDGQWHIRDNATRNGTYLNGTRLEQDREYPIHPGDVISFARKEEAEILR